MGERLASCALPQQALSERPQTLVGKWQVISSMQSTSPNLFMLRAIEVAKLNPHNPFGVVLVETASHVIVAEGVNQSSRNPTLHAEIDAINKYAVSGETDWARLTLYTTAEPCPMCMSPILWSGISKVVYGTSIPILIKLGWDQIDIRALSVVARSYRTNCEVIPGVPAGECDALFHNAAHAVVGT